MDNRPIGVFDSGLGGLTVLKHLKKLLPKENFIYLGDTARVPYGTRSRETVIRFSKQDADFLLRKDVKMIVIACNTASAYAYESVSEMTEIPVFGVIDETVKSAVNVTKNNKIAIIGTKGTITSGAYQNAVRSQCRSCQVIVKACPLLVPLIEEGETSGKLITLAVKKYLAEFDNEEYDALILGCTHYPLIKNIIKKEIDHSIKLIDPGEETAKLVKHYLNNKDMASVKGVNDVEFYLTDLGPDFYKVAENFLGEKIEKVSKIELK